jgi:hypothetical protein
VTVGTLRASHAGTEGTHTSVDNALTASNLRGSNDQVCNPLGRSARLLVRWNREYFTSACQKLQKLKVEFKDSLLRIYGDTAVKRDGQWLIVDHHSSSMPAN